MKTITPAELKHRLDRHEVLLIDVREPAEYRTECIEGAVLIPLNDFSLETLPSQSKPIVIQCLSGKRSSEACRKAFIQNPDAAVYTLEGGISAWKNAGFPTKKSASNTLPLDQQTQLTAGFLVFIGTLAGTWANPVFYIIPGFIGLGLMFAGITGWCGLAKLLAKMFWNR